MMSNSPSYEMQNYSLQRRNVYRKMVKCHDLVCVCRASISCFTPSHNHPSLVPGPQDYTRLESVPVSTFTKLAAGIVIPCASQCPMLLRPLLFALPTLPYRDIQTKPSRIQRNSAIYSHRVLLEFVVEQGKDVDNVCSLIAYLSSDN